ncbi:MAG: hypothetical protein OXC61_01775 [Flavobacteriaceae bacterium]|nr:hypothetical protein [Flavobacteriaceae bacterium]
MALDRGLGKLFSWTRARKETISVLSKYDEKGKIKDLFLIQGSPGVGKTALWEHCCAMAKKQGWKIVLIDRSTL